MELENIDCNKRGFTLIELLVVVLIIGILAAIAVPQYFRVVEKGRFAEAASCFNSLKGAEERFRLKTNTYTTILTDLDVQCANLKAFDAPVGSAANETTYTITMQRKAPLPALYSDYTLSYTGPAGTFACSDTGTCARDLLPY